MKPRQAWSPARFNICSTSACASIRWKSWGNFSSSPTSSAVLVRDRPLPVHGEALSFLDLNSSFYTLLQDVHSEAGTNKPFYVGSPYLTEIAIPTGRKRRLSLVEEHHLRGSDVRIENGMETAHRGLPHSQSLQ